MGRLCQTIEFRSVWVLGRHKRLHQAIEFSSNGTVKIGCAKEVRQSRGKEGMSKGQAMVNHTTTRISSGIMKYKGI